MTMTMTVARTLAVALLATAAGVHAQDKAAPPANVEVALAKTTNLAPQRWVPGSVVSRDDARIASAEAGRLEFVAEVGTHVKVGERIAKLDDRALRLRREEIQSDVRRTEAQSNLAATQLERLKKLTSTNSIAATQLDDARGLAETNVQNVAHARAQLRQIEHDIDQSEVRAPFSGVVTERFAQRGEYVQTGAAIVHLVDADHVEARVQAPIALAGSIKAGTAVTVKSGDVEQAAKVRAMTRPRSPLAPV
ncbi:MAG: efflux RND transporter periplasmic adaptor subunit, partial [Dokdonella sp.]